MDEALIVFVTAPDAEVAARLARTLVEEGLVACGNLITGVRSIYTWQGKIEDESEVLIVFKTRRARFEALRARIVTLHPYTTPEILALPVVAGHPPYLAWVLENT